MKKIIIILVFFLNFPIAYCQHPFKQNLGNIATVTFPDTPKTKNIEYVKLFYCNYNDLFYIAQASALDSGLKDLLKDDNNDTLYNSFIESELKSTNGKLFYKRAKKINTLTGIEYGFTIISNGQTYYNYNNLFYINDQLVSYSIRSQDSLKKDDKKINTFFDTFKLTVPNNEVRQSGGQEIGYKLGHVVAVLLMIGIICAIGGLIVYIIMRINNKKQS